MADFLDVKRREIAERMREIKPLVDEYQRLEAAASALEGVGGTATGRSAGRASTARRGRPRATGAKRGRRRGSGTRSAQALKLVRGQPGITIPELADKMKIKQNYLYRVLPGLEADGLVAKQGRGWHPKGSG